MAEYKIAIQNRIASVEGGVKLVCNNPTDSIRFEFDEEWSGKTVKTARFSWEENKIDVPFSGDVVKVPEIFRTNYVFIGVFTDDLATTPVKVNCRYSIKCLGSKPVPPSEDVYNEIIALINDGITVNDSFTPRPFEASGKLVQLDNFEGMPMNAVTRIEPVQAGSGDPYPAGGGKNLMPFTNSEQTSGGVTFKPQSDGRIHIEGTASANISYNLCGQWQSQTGVTLRAGYKYSRTTNITGVEAIAYGYNSGGAYKMIPEGALTEDYSNAYIYLQVNSGRVVNGYFAPTLTVNGWSAEYIPYANIRPISGHTGAKLTRVGKNLAEQIVYGYVTLDGNNAYVRIDNNSTSVIAGVVEGNEYTISCSATLDRFGVGKLEAANPTNNALLTGYRFYGNQSSAHELHFTAEFTGTAFIYLKSTKDETAKDSLQVEIGSVATEYTPYQGETFSASFGQTVYGGTLDWGKGVLTVDGKIVTLTGGEDWKWFASYDFVYCTGLQSAFEAWPEDLVCSHYKLSVDESQENAYVTIVSTGTYNDQLRFYHTGYTSADAWKSFLSAQNAAGTPVQVCYKLANPITIQLTPAQLTALQGMNNIFCDAGETTVSGRKDILWLTSGLIERIKTLETAIVSMGGNV